MAFRRKKDGSTPRRSSGVPESALARPRKQGNHWENQWTHPPPEPGLPGICGYLNGIQEPEEGIHPTRFRYVRPDGMPEDYVPLSADVVPCRPSQRPVPKGFFGP